MAENLPHQDDVDRGVHLSADAESPAISDGGLEVSAPSSSNTPGTMPSYATASPPSRSFSSGKQQREQSVGEDLDTPGSTAVNERAPDLNIRTFRFASMRLARIVGSSVRRDGMTLTTRDGAARVERDRNPPSGVPTETTSGFSSDKDSNVLDAFTRAVSARSDNLVAATVVDDVVFEAERIPFLTTKAKALVAFASCMASFVVVAIFLTIKLTRNEDQAVPTTMPSMMPSMMPSSSPSYIPGPTYDAVRSRGKVRCGIGDNALSIDAAGNYSGFSIDLCRAIAAVIFGDPESYINITTTSKDRFVKLQEKETDLSVRGDTHTMKREIFEESARSGFKFSAPFLYDGLMFAGASDYVACANDFSRHGACRGLSICVKNSTTHYEFLRKAIPFSYLHVVSSSEELLVSYEESICNVIAGESHQVANFRSNLAGNEFEMGGNFFTNEPLAIVTRKDDKQWSNIMDLVLQALFYGEKYGVSQSLDQCTKKIDDLPPTGRDFLNAIYCVGNYEQVFRRILDNGVPRTEINELNNGTTGLFYPLPYGELDAGTGALLDFNDTLNVIRRRGKLRCGVSYRDGFYYNISKDLGNQPCMPNLHDKSFANELSGSSVFSFGLDAGLCRALSVAIFEGDPTAVEFVALEDSRDVRFAALANGTVDVLAGSEVDLSYKEEGASTDASLHPFSTPYYYGMIGGEDRVYFLECREDDIYFSSFVNLLVQKYIGAPTLSTTSLCTAETLPLVTLFGINFEWMLRDVKRHHPDDYSMNIMGKKSLCGYQFPGFPELDDKRNILNGGTTPGPQHFILPEIEEYLNLARQLE